jgi:alanine dehydrogenase
MRLVRDRDIEDLVDRDRAVREMEAGYRAAADGSAVVFPRSRNAAETRTLAWLGAALPRLDLLGFRAYLYDDSGSDRGEQITALYRFGSMDLRAVFVGRICGILRTGAALVAAVRMAEPEVRDLTLLGTGTQAREFALTAARTLSLERMVVWSPTRANRERFAEDLSRRGSRVAAVDSLEAAVRDARVVVLTTSSARPVVSSEMLRPDALVATIQGYRASQHDVDPNVYDRAEVIWTDSVEQASAPGTLFERPPLRSKLEALGRGAVSGRIRDSSRARAIVNTGAPWQEVLMANALLANAESNSRGILADLGPGL